MRARVTVVTGQWSPLLVDVIPAEVNVGGSSLPAQWTDGGSGDVTAQVDDAAKTPFVIAAIAGQEPAEFSTLFRIDGFDVAPLTGTAIVYSNGAVEHGFLDANGYFLIDGPGGSILYTDPTIFRVSQKALPADGALTNSSFALWLDDTPGATKLKIKAKDSGGTVRTGEVALT
jgi:hypothetical protein